MLGRILPFVNHYLGSFVQKEEVTPPVVMSFGYLIERVGCSVGQDRLFDCADRLFGWEGLAVRLCRFGYSVVQDRMFGCRGLAVRLVGWLVRLGRIGCSVGQDLDQLFGCT